MDTSTLVRRLVLCGMGLSLAPGLAVGQGCMPLKFLAPSLAGLQSAYLRRGEWRVSLGVRRVAANRFYVGSVETPDSAPGGQPLYIRLNGVDLGVTYALTERISLTVSLPYSYNTADLVDLDSVRRFNSAAGFGDVNLVANYWVLDPGSHVNGNIYVGLGAKAPTGSYHSEAPFGVPGQVGQWTAPQTVQPGDGGWALLAQIQAYQQVAGLLAGYVSAEYSASIRQHTDVIWPPVGQLWAVPDVYSARTGLSYGVAPQWGLSLSAGWRVDGTTSKDVFHTAGDYYRHAGYSMYVEPGLSLVRGPNQVTLTLPIRVRADYLTTTTSTGPRIGSGGVNDYVIYASWSRRM